MRQGQRETYNEGGGVQQDKREEGCAESRKNMKQDETGSRKAERDEKQEAQKARRAGSIQEGRKIGRAGSRKDGMQEGMGSRMNRKRRGA